MLSYKPVTQQPTQISSAEHVDIMLYKSSSITLDIESYEKRLIYVSALSLVALWVNTVTLYAGMFAGKMHFLCFYRTGYGIICHQDMVYVLNLIIPSGAMQC